MKAIYRLTALILIVILMAGMMTIGASAGELKQSIGIVTASALRLRREPNTSSDVIKTALKGDKVVVIDYEDGWYRVLYNLKEGYMKAEYLDVLEKENVELGVGNVNTYAFFRTGPSTDYASIKLLSTNTSVQIIGLNCGWYKVTCNGDTGYIRSDLVDLTEIPYCNSGSSNGSSSSYTSKSLGEQVVDLAEQYLGVPYVWGGTSTSGFDCSGFVQYIYKQMGVSINRGATAQMSNGTRVSSSELRPGDLVFFEGTYNTTGASHVGIYIGNGQFIHASSAKGCVTISDLWGSSYYTAHYYGARRIFN